MAWSEDRRRTERAVCKLATLAVCKLATLAFQERCRETAAMDTGNQSDIMLHRGAACAYEDAIAVIRHVFSRWREPSRR